MACVILATPIIPTRTNNDDRYFLIPIRACLNTGTQLCLIKCFHILIFLLCCKQIIKML
jgi:hypothetical protein